MRLAFLGDALDHWKGAVLSQAGSGCFRDLSIDAMLTDTLLWQAPHLQLYANLLQVQVEQIIEHQANITNQRGAYFNELVGNNGDLFLDPDTGIRTGWVFHRERYIEPREVASLLAAAPARLLVVYQHVRQAHVRTRIGRVASVLCAVDAAVVGCSCESATAALLFLSHSPDRVQCVYHALGAFFGPFADERVIQWPHAPQPDQR